MYYIYIYIYIHIIYIYIYICRRAEAAAPPSSNVNILLCVVFGPSNFYLSLSLFPSLSLSIIHTYIYAKSTEHAPLPTSTDSLSTGS